MAHNNGDGQTCCASNSVEQAAESLLEEANCFELCIMSYSPLVLEVGSYLLWIKQDLPDFNRHLSSHSSFSVGAVVHAFPEFLQK